MLTLLALVFSFSPPLAAPLPQEGYPKLSPFQAVEWRAETPDVEVDGVWYTLVAIEGVPVSKLVAFSKLTYGSRWQKRIDEDLVQVLSELGAPPGKTVSLDLVRRKDGDEVALEDVVLTGANREAVRRRRGPGPARRPKPTAPIERVEREHAKRVAAEHEFLTRLLPEPTAWGAKPLTAEQVAADLDQLEWLLEDSFAYLRLRGVDYRALLDAVRPAASADAGATALDRGSFALQLRKILAQFGDGHTRVGGLQSKILTPGFLPLAAVAVGSANERVAAIGADGQLLDAKRPWLVAIDGEPLEHWLAVAGSVQAQGSPQLIRRGALDVLPFIVWLRHERGARAKDSVSVTLAADGGKRGKQKKLKVATRPVRHAWLPKQPESRVLADNIGYLRIPGMDSGGEFETWLARAMDELAETAGLIIDVRDNGGGSRSALRTLFPYFMAPKAAPHVANVSAYRLPAGVPRGDEEGYLGNRELYPVTASAWSAPEREAIEERARRFKPDWQFDAEAFSAWHYFVLTRPQDAPAYPEPVVILMDEGCFSATDIFLGAFKGQPDVTLMGTASSGGSGRSRTTELAHSGIEVRLSSMVSFTPEGALYEGRGIEPDVVLARTLEDVLGEGDTVLEAAASLLTE